MRPSKMSAYHSYLEQQWQAGQHNATQLWRDIQKEGFSGSRGLVAQWAAKQRKMLPGKRGAPATPILPHVQIMAPSRAVWLLLRRENELEPEEQAALTRMTQEDALVDLAYTLGQKFFTMVHKRQADQLDAWIDQATRSHISTLKTFARGCSRISKLSELL